MPLFGMPTLLQAPSIEECAELCGELGLNFIELNMNLPQYQPDRLDIVTLRRISRENGIFFTAHLDERLDYADFDRRVALAYRETALRAIDAALELDVPVLNFHLPRGVYFTLPQSKVYLYGEHRERYLEATAEFRRVCEDSVGGGAITLCAENCGVYAAHEREALEILLQSPIFALTLDVGHAFGDGGAQRDLIAAHRGKLRHMHLHDACRDANGIKRDHLPLGEGSLDIAGALALADEVGARVLLEVKTESGLRSSVKWLHDNNVIF